MTRPHQAVRATREPSSDSTGQLPKVALTSAIHPNAQRRSAQPDRIVDLSCDMLDFDGATVNEIQATTESQRALLKRKEVSANQSRKT